MPINFPEPGTGFADCNHIGARLSCRHIVRHIVRLSCPPLVAFPLD